MKVCYLLFVLITFSSCAHPGPHAGKYKRKDWKHWVDRDKNCLNTRHELLKNRSLSSVQTDKRGCKVKRGEWDDFYYPEKLFEAKMVDVDHVIPLKHAHDVGAASWSSQQKEAFANDPENLVLTNRKYNRIKKAKTVAEWLPVNPEYACRYVKLWFSLKAKYRLQVTPPERETKDALKGRCSSIAH